MSLYETLVTKYRPRRIKDIVGQETAKGQIEGMFASGKISRQFLISGPFGTGKTSIARIIARYLNCLENDGNKNYQACGSCKSCLMMDNGSHPDVIEINASSERGIDMIKDVNEKQQLNPQCRYKVFILDEAHGLTGPAASAFLKTLEEPSPKSIFMLCSTNPEKIPNNIKSRCQKVDLKLVDSKEIARRLLYICKKEDFKLGEKEALKISELSMGHVRDSVQMLESVINYASSKKNINIVDDLPKIVHEVIKASPSYAAGNYLISVFNKDYEGTLKNVLNVDSAEYFMQLVIGMLKQALIIKKAPSLGNPSPMYQKIANITKNGTDEYFQLLQIHLSNYERLKQYSIDPKDILFATAFESVRYIAKQK